MAGPLDQSRALILILTREIADDEHPDRDAVLEHRAADVEQLNGVLLFLQPSDPQKWSLGRALAEEGQPPYWSLRTETVYVNSVADDEHGWGVRRQLSLRRWLCTSDGATMARADAIRQLGERAVLE